MSKNPMYVDVSREYVHCYIMSSPYNSELFERRPIKEIIDQITFYYNQFQADSIIFDDKELEFCYNLTKEITNE